MKVALDANRYSDLCRGIAKVVEQTSHAERVYLPLIVLGELRAGFQAGSRARAKRADSGSISQFTPRATVAAG